MHKEMALKILNLYLVGLGFRRDLSIVKYGYSQSSAKHLVGYRGY